MTTAMVPPSHSANVSTMSSTQELQCVPVSANPAVTAFTSTAGGRRSGDATSTLADERVPLHLDLMAARQGIGSDGIRKEGRAARPCLVAGHAVDLLTQDVGVTVVARVLLDHVDVDPGQVEILVRTRMPERLVQ